MDKQIYSDEKLDCRIIEAVENCPVNPGIGEDILVTGATADSNLSEHQVCLFIAGMYLPMIDEVCKEHSPAGNLSVDKTLKLFKEQGIPILTEFNEDYLEKIFGDIKKGIKNEVPT